MAKHKSATGRTVVELNVGAAGDMSLRVSRDGHMVDSLDLPREQGIGADDYIEVTDGVAVVMGDAGPDGVARRKAAFNASTGESVALPAAIEPVEEMPHGEDNYEVSAHSAPEPVH